MPSPPKWLACPTCMAVLHLDTTNSRRFRFCGACEQDVIPVLMDHAALSAWAADHPGVRYDELAFAIADMQAENYFKPDWERV